MRATRTQGQRLMWPPSLAAGRGSASRTHRNRQEDTHTTRVQALSALQFTASPGPLLFGGPGSGFGSSFGSGFGSPRLASLPLPAVHTRFGNRLRLYQPCAPPLVLPGPLQPLPLGSAGEAWPRLARLRVLCSTPPRSGGDTGSRLLGDFSAVGTGVRICRRVRTERRKRTGQCRT